MYSQDAPCIANLEIKNLEASRDHVRLLFKSAPTTDLAKFIDVLNVASALRTRNEYGDRIEDKLWVDSFWADSYCLISTGQVSLDVLKEHVENQRGRDDE